MQIEPTQKPIEFLDTVLKDYNYYTCIIIWGSHGPVEEQTVACL